MKTLKIRVILVFLHRYIGLFVGLVLALIGLTGSLLVFHDEIEEILVKKSLGDVIPEGQPVGIDQIFSAVQTEVSRIGFKTLFLAIVPPAQIDLPYQARLYDSGGLTQMFIHPYTGKVMGTLQAHNKMMDILLHLHYQLLADEMGTQIVGIAALFLLVLSLTDIALWPGWRNLINGFKIKWNGHPKRLNFDVHKVVGIVAAVFLSITAFTGFCWNFASVTQPMIYAVTLTSKQPKPQSKPIVWRSMTHLSTLVKNADAALPGGRITWINMPTGPTDSVTIYKQLPGSAGDFDNVVYLDQFSGKVLRAKTASEMSLGDRVILSFIPLHFGTFGGLFTRILYVFVGLAPSILLITGWVMWRYRKPNPARFSVIRTVRTIAKHS